MLFSGGDDVGVVDGVVAYVVNVATPYVAGTAAAVRVVADATW